MSKLLVEKRGHLTILTMNRPKVLNALDFDLIQALNATFAELRDDPDCWAVVLTGADSIFTSGVDVRSLKSKTEEFGAQKVAKMFNLEPAMPGYDFDKPVFAAIEGNCVGFGLALAFAADIRVCSKDVKFLAPEAKLGLPALGIPIAGPAAIGPGATMELLTVGGARGAKWGFRTGLVQEICDPGQALEGALKLAAQCLEQAPLAVRAQKRIMKRMMQNGIQDALSFGVELRSHVIKSDDYREGISSFTERRKPVFSGK